MEMERITYSELLQEGKALLETAAVQEADIDSWLLLEYVTGMDRSCYFLKSTETAAEEEMTVYRKLISQRAGHIPLQYLTGVQEFMGLPFWVNQDVLVPRQDTECLVETALEFAKGKKVLDLCTGSGCIAVSLVVLGQVKECHAADLSAKALETARKNAKRNNAEITFMESDLFEKVTEVYDIILSNPPYIPGDEIEGLSEEVRGHEPHMALDGGMDGLIFYRRIAAESKAYLADGGMLFFEIGCEQAEAVREIMEAEGFYDIVCKKDYAGNDRVVYGKKGKENV